MYSLRAYLRALLLAPLCTIPVVVACVLVSRVFASGSSSSSGASWAIAIVVAFALPTAYVATLVFATPFVISANRAGAPIAPHSALAVGLVIGLVAAAAWLFLIAQGPGGATSPFLLLLIGASSGFATGYFFERLLG